MAKGSLYNFLHKQKGVFKLPSLIKVVVDVSKGMNYLHKNNIIHMDLKTDNLLMDENDVRAFPELACTCLYSSMFTRILNSWTVLFFIIVFPLLSKNFLAMHVELIAHCLGLVFILVVSDVLICIFGILIVLIFTLLSQVVKVDDFGFSRVRTQSGVMTAETGTYQ